MPHNPLRPPGSAGTAPSPPDAVVSRWLLAQRGRAIVDGAEVITPEHDPLAFLDLTNTGLGDLGHRESPGAPAAFVLGLLQGRFRRVLDAFLSSQDTGLDGREVKDCPGFFPFEIDTAACLRYLEYLADEGLGEARPLRDEVRRIHDAGALVDPAGVGRLLAMFYSVLPAMVARVPPPAVRTVTVPSGLDDSLYGRRRPSHGEAVTGFAAWARSRLSPGFSFLCVHGSLATEDDVPGFSDFDTFGVVRASVTTSAEALLELRQVLTGAWPYFYRVDALQHHGVMLVAEQDLAFYSEAFFPTVLFDHARTILTDGSTLAVASRPCRFDERSAFVQTVQYFRHHALARTELTDAFSLKHFVAIVLLAPALYYQAIGRPVYKRTAFEWVDAEWDAADRDWLREVSAIRADGLLTQFRTPVPPPEDGDIRAILSFHREARRVPVPPAIIERLGPRFIDDAFEWSERLYARFRRHVPSPGDGGDPNASAYRLVELPVPLTEADYDRAQVGAMRSIQSLAPRATVARFGSVTAPGISDVDLMIVLDGADHPHSLNELPDAWSRGGFPFTDVFFHPPPFVAARGDLDDVPEVYPIFGWQTIGADLAVIDRVSVDVNRYREGHLLALAEIAMLYFLRDTVPAILSRVLRARPLLMRLSGLRHSLAVLRNAGHADPAWDPFVEGVDAMRSNWFALSPGDRRAGVLALAVRGLRLQLDIIDRLRGEVARLLSLRDGERDGPSSLCGVLDRDVLFVTNWTPSRCLELVEQAWTRTGQVFAPLPEEFAALLSVYRAGPPHLSAALTPRFVSAIPPDAARTSLAVERHIAALERRLSSLAAAGLHWGALPHWGFDPVAPAPPDRLWRDAAERARSANDGGVMAYVSSLAETPPEVIGAREFVGTGQYAEAVRTLRSCIERAPENAEAHYLMGCALVGAGGNASGALEHFSRALEAGFSAFWVRFRRGLLHEAMRHVSEAEEDLAVAVELEPGHDAARLAWERVKRRDPLEPLRQLVDAGATQEAAARLRHLLDSDPDNGEAHYLLGCCADADGAVEAALRHFDAAITCGAATCWVFGRRAAALAQAGRVEEAARDLDRALAIAGDRRDAWAFLADVRRRVHASTAGSVMAQGHQEDALRALDREVAARPADAELWYLRARCLAEAGRAEDALRDYTRAIALGGHEYWARLNRAHLLISLRRLDEARPDVERAAELDADRPDTMALAQRFAWHEGRRPDADTPPRS